MMTQGERALITFHGHVQGVGFRATSARLARSFDITGNVSNRKDGTVKMDVEGPRVEITRFLEALHDSRLGSCIDREEIVWGNATGRGRGFEIQYW
jgi:acylphosphatase